METALTARPEHQRSGLAAGVGAYATWGALTLYWRQLHHFSAAELVAWRIITSAVVMGVVLTATRRWGHLRPVLRDRTLLIRVLLAASLLTGNWSTYVFAVVHGHVLETALGYFIAPLGTMTIGMVVFHERLRRHQVAAIVFALAAIAVLAVSYGRVPWIALALALTWNFYGLLKKQVPLTPLESISAETFVVLVPAIVVATALAGGANSIPSTAGPREWFLVALTGVATVVPLMLFAWAAQHVPLTVLGPLNYLVPTINFLLGWLVFDEPLPKERWIGFALVWIGLLVMTVGSVHAQWSVGRSPEVVELV